MRCRRPCNWWSGGRQRSQSNRARGTAVEQTGLPRSVLPAQPARLQRRQVCHPPPILLATQFMQVFPRVDPRVVQVIEGQPHGIIADRLDPDDGDGALARKDLLLAPSVTLDFGARALYP